MNKKSLKKATIDCDGFKENPAKEVDNNFMKTPGKVEATEDNFFKSPTSNSSDEENNLSRISGLIISDGLVGENQIRIEEITKFFS